MNKQLIMLSGLPRSGSTVLSSMLNQHPSIHATTTSPLIDLISIINENWPAISQAIKSPEPTQYANMITGLIDGTYKHIQQPVIVDKNRLWPRFGNLMHYALKRKPKIICTVRSIPDILASYILLLNKNPQRVSFVDDDLNQMNLPINMKNRCKILWEKYTMHPYTSLRMGFQSNEVDICLVEYNDIVTNPQLVIDKISNFIGIDTYQINTTSLQSMDENDDYHGGLKGLHDIRSLIKKTSPDPEQVIGNDLVKYYSSLKLEFWNK